LSVSGGKCLHGNRPCLKAWLHVLDSHWNLLFVGINRTKFWGF